MHISFDTFSSPRNILSILILENVEESKTVYVKKASSFISFNTFFNPSRVFIIFVFIEVSFFYSSPIIL